MINGMPIFYSSKTGNGLKVVSTKAKGLELAQTKRGKGCNNAIKNAIKSELMGVV